MARFRRLHAASSGALNLVRLVGEHGRAMMARNSWFGSLWRARCVRRYRRGRRHVARHRGADRGGLADTSQVRGEGPKTIGDFSVAGGEVFPFHPDLRVLTSAAARAGGTAGGARLTG